ncbi:acyl-CoA dehydrogenase family protein [Streptomyces sp. NPDC006879]|uniref:acyl-CoA dehydrogenase family protein n=1 Tax=Streptomyces sp. NPDC006879 TaxID=3364767 RepID=UPI003673DF2B
MRFLPTEEQLAFARSLSAQLTAADPPTLIRSWAAGDFAAGRALWSRLAETGLFALAVTEEHTGLGDHPVELALAYRELGRHAVPGPLVETAAAATLLHHLGEPALAKRLLPSIVSGEAITTLHLAAVPAEPTGYRAMEANPYVLDPQAATLLLAVPASARGEAELRLSPGHGPVIRSTDPARRLATPVAGGELLAGGPAVRAAARQAARRAALLTAAQALGCGEALLAATVAHAKRRTQFGVPIGGFQAVKHRLADTFLALEFARPLLWAAAVSGVPADIAAAKLTAGEAAYRAARTALQVHGAIGYTEELDLSLWIRKARPLRDAWGNPAQCRARVRAVPSPP